MANKHISSEQLQAYLDQILGGSELNDVIQHLEACLECQKEFARLEGIFARLERLPELKLEKDLSISVIARLKEEAKLPRGITWTLMLEVLAVGTIIGLLIPAFRTATWLPELIDTQTEVLAAINIFLTQMASSWLVWWTGLRLNFVQFTKSLITIDSLPVSGVSPWALVLAAAGLGLLANYFLLRIDPLRNQNHS